MDAKTHSGCTGTPWLLMIASLKCVWRQFGCGILPSSCHVWLCIFLWLNSLETTLVVTNCVVCDHQAPVCKVVWAKNYYKTCDHRQLVKYSKQHRDLIPMRFLKVTRSLTVVVAALMITWFGYTEHIDKPKTRSAVSFNYVLQQDNHGNFYCRKIVLSPAPTACCSIRMYT